VLGKILSRLSERLYGSPPKPPAIDPETKRLLLALVDRCKRLDKIELATYLIFEEMRRREPRVTVELQKLHDPLAPQVESRVTAAYAALDQAIAAGADPQAVLQILQRLDRSMQEDR